MGKADGQAFRAELRAGIKLAVSPLVRSVQAQALETLPKRGGLNAWVADATYTTSVIASGNRVGIRIKGTKKGHDLEAVDAGVVRHPVFGNRNAWRVTNVQPGYFTKPLQASAPIVEASLLAVLDRQIAKLRSL